MASYLMRKESTKLHNHLETNVHYHCHNELQFLLCASRPVLSYPKIEVWKWKLLPS